MDWVEVRDALLTQRPVPPSQAEGVGEPGVYAWYDLDGALARFYPDDYASVDPSLPLYVGLAEKDSLASRIVGTHLVDTRRSALRRSLVALLSDQLELLPGVIPAAKGKYGLAPDYESKLTNWMNDARLRVTWVTHETPGIVEKSVIANLLSPLNYTFAVGSPYRRRMWLLRRELRTAALNYPTTLPVL
jgi:hypothetical protein